MKHFRQQLDDLTRPEVHRDADRQWLFVPYDQLSDAIGPLAHEDPATLGIVLVENTWKAAQRPYHRQKLAMVLANLRHFAIEQAARGVAVRHVVTHGPYREALRPLIDELGPLRMMTPAERELRVDLAPLVANDGLVMQPHEGWLTTTELFARLGKPPWRMDAFYRRVRRDTGILMEDGKPVGGKYSFDAENRKPWRGEPAAPTPPTFEPDAVTIEVGELIEQHFTRHPGTLDLTTLPATRNDAEHLWAWARDTCLPLFGPYEDAMTVESTGLFHTRVSPLVNLHRLLPQQVVDDVLALDIPLASQEGFIRQVLGWREFVHHVHVATDGFRQPGDGTHSALVVADAPGDGGWGRWRDASWHEPDGHGEEPGDGKTGNEDAGDDVSGNDVTADGGACPNHLDADADLPVAYWGRPSGLACLDRVVDDVWKEGWSHHITRLMVLSNLATLLDLDPRQLTDWFWVAYIDAYDWVVEPNVLAMGTFATGPLMTTKPYVSGAAYIDRMSDYCGTCRFHPKKTCPITSLYWSFLDRHRDQLTGNHRMAMPLRSLAKRAADKRTTDRDVFETVRAALAAGDTLHPGNGPVPKRR